MSFIKGPVVAMDQVPPSLFDAMDAHLKQEAAKGHFLSGGGLWPSSGGLRAGLPGS